MGGLAPVRALVLLREHVGSNRWDRGAPKSRCDSDADARAHLPLAGGPQVALAQRPPGGVHAIPTTMTARRTVNALGRDLRDRWVVANP